MITEYNKELYCANCGRRIEAGEEYFKCLENYMLVKYYDSEDCNIFCSKECLCESLFLETYYNGEESDAWNDLDEEEEE